MTKNALYRQGDVLLMQVDALPQGSKVQGNETPSVVLAYGETTGHCHQIASTFAKMFSHGTDTYIQTIQGAILRHEEHDPIALPAGCYKVVLQREYEPEGARFVHD